MLANNSTNSLNLPGARQLRTTGSVIEVAGPSYTVSVDASGQDPDLRGCLEKLARASEHRDLLDHELRLFMDSDPYRGVGKVEKKSPWYVFRIDAVREPPMRIGVILGEYVHQIRSSFDHFAWALATLKSSGKKPKSVVSFPIDTNPTKFQEAALYRLHGHVEPGWVAIIEAIQPYNARDHSLAVLKDLWNRDKHQVVIPVPDPEFRTLNAAQYLPKANSCTITEPRLRFRERLVGGAELARVKLATTTDEPAVDMYVLAFAQIAVEKPGGTPRQLMLWTLAEAELILRFLLSVFPGGATALGANPYAIGNRAYPTVITTCGSEAEAVASGFRIVTSEERRPRP